MRRHPYTHAPQYGLRAPLVLSSAIWEMALPLVHLVWVALGLFLVMDLNFLGDLFILLVSDYLFTSVRKRVLLPFGILEKNTMCLSWMSRCLALCLCSWHVMPGSHFSWARLGQTRQRDRLLWYQQHFCGNSPLSWGTVLRKPRLHGDWVTRGVTGLCNNPSTWV